MRIALLAHDLTDPFGRGLQRYTVGLAQALSAVPEVELFLMSRRPLVAELDGLAAHREVWLGRREILWEQVDVPGRLQRLGIDVLHAPSNRGLPAFTSCATVLTRHDEIDQLFPPDFHGSLRSRFRLFYADQISMRRARRIITVSQRSCGDIERRWRLAPGRVVVCGEGIDECFFRAVSADEIKAVRERWGLPGPYVLYVGGFGGRKDIGTLLEAFFRLGRSGLTLALCGSLDGETEELRRRVAERGAGAGVCINGRIPDVDLPALYAACELFVYPSRYEGFGLQVLEAMAAGAPVLTSDGGALPETAGGAGRVFPAGDADACARAIGELLDSEAERSRMRRAGAERARSFRWSGIIQNYLRIYREVAG